MKELGKKLNESFKNEVLGTTEDKQKYLTGLKKIEEEHKSFFKEKPSGKNKIENYVFPNNFLGRPILGLNYESEINQKLKLDLIELWDSIFSKKEK